MKPSAITIIVEGEYQINSDKTSAEFDEYPKFAKQLKEYCATEVDIVEVKWIESAPKEGILIVDSGTLRMTKGWPDYYATMVEQVGPKRIFLINTIPDDVEFLHETLEIRGYAGAIHGRAYLQHRGLGTWYDYGRHVVHGLKSIAKKIGASLDEHECGERYAMMYKEGYDLPRLTAEYLVAYWNEHLAGGR